MTRCPLVRRPALLAVALALAACGSDRPDAVVAAVDTIAIEGVASIGGSIEPKWAAATAGDPVTFIVAPAAGYLVRSVSGCGGTLNGQRFVTAPVDRPCTVHASFRRPVVSGTLNPAAATAVDRDVNDPDALHASNDTFDDAQPIENPVALGGWVDAMADADDVFRARLRAGQAVTLHIADDAADLDLYLFDEQRRLVDAALDPAARTRVLTVGTDGDHFVLVHAFAGASTYLLTVEDTPPHAVDGWVLSDPFIVGDAVLRFRDGANEKRGGTLRAHARAAGWLHGRELEVDERPLRVTLDALPASHRSTDKRGAVAASAWPDAQRGRLDTALAVKALYHDPDVADAHPNFLYQTTAVSDPYYSYQWNHRQIAAVDAWRITRGSGVVVAVLDTGVVHSHPDLQGQLLPGHDFVRALVGGEDPGTSPRPQHGSNFHGTHVAGIIAAATDNGIGVSGVAPRARILPVRVCNTKCSGYAIDQGLRFAAGLPNDSGGVPNHPARVINLSLGRTGSASSREQQLFTYLYDRGITVVAAAGNENNDLRFYPAAYNHVLAVGATDYRMVRAPYSNWGPWVDLVAPGGDTTRDRSGDGYVDGVLSTGAIDRDGSIQTTYRFMQGTSMATPHVAGVVALMKAAAPALTPADIHALLRAEALTDDLGAPGRDDVFGHGMVNAHKAAIAARDYTGGAIEPIPAPDADTETVPGSVEGGEPPAGGLGRQYVLLVDPGTFMARHRTVAEFAGDGSYTFRFDDVTPGTYLLIAGADHDGDGRICATGEPCGAHRSFNKPVLVDVVDRDVTGRDVRIEYRVMPRPMGRGLREQTFER